MMNKFQSKNKLEQHEGGIVFPHYEDKQILEKLIKIAKHDECFVEQERLYNTGHGVDMKYRIWVYGNVVTPTGVPFIPEGRFLPSSDENNFVSTEDGSANKAIEEAYRFLKLKEGCYDKGFNHSIPKSEFALIKYESMNKNYWKEFYTKILSNVCFSYYCDKWNIINNSQFRNVSQSEVENLYHIIQPQQSSRSPNLYYGRYPSSKGLKTLRRGYIKRYIPNPKAFEKKSLNYEKVDDDGWVKEFIPSFIYQRIEEEFKIRIPRLSSGKPKPTKK